MSSEPIVFGWHKRPLFIFALGFDTAPPGIFIYLDGEGAWSFFMSRIQQGTPISCRYAEHQRGWHPATGFTHQSNPED
ncbi:hypothetical protein FHP25_36040 [Vineibacter terrae]|uniref:Uncharacterized protein n=1 Tax=Vineibacter terrae TaxID=2586908 RepID=A0A5C8P9N7_9HYPH|nr:hypothetical protein [Vineibacter terrae]TXL70136.1 hypothetical protein FHP25_36040 [Vineibacter terrae]